MKTNIKVIAIALATATALMTASAQNVFIAGTGTTNWQGTPAVQTGASATLASVFTISENAYTASPSYLPMLGQTFTATVSGTIQNIQLYAGGAAGDNYVFLWDLGAASSYAAVSGASMPASLQSLSGYSSFSYPNLFGDGSYFHFNGGGQSVRLLTFSSAPSVTAGNLYYFGIAPNVTSAVMSWQRTSSEPYTGGCAYKEYGWLNGSGPRDFAMAVTMVPEPSTMALMSLVGGAALLGLRRNRRS
jgi:hypothetical protein